MLRALTATLLALAAATLVPSAARAQGAPLSVEARLGAALPTGSFAGGDGVGEGTSSGTAFGVEVAVGSRTGRRTLYAGFSQLRFGCVEAGCASGGRYVATGVNAGVRFSLLPGRAWTPWLGAGAFTVRVESPGVRGSAAGVSELGYGAEASAGLAVRVGPSLLLTPAVRLSRAGTDLPGGVRLPLRWAVVDLGVAVAF